MKGTKKELGDRAADLRGDSEGGVVGSQGTQADLEKKVAELTADLQRTRADFENYRKQMDAQKAGAVRIAQLETVAKVLPLLDNIERAVATTAELEPLGKSLEKTAKELGLEKIEAREGVEFNPELHEAIVMEEGEGEKAVVAEVLRSGYKYGGEVLRPTMVKAKNTN